MATVSDYYIRPITAADYPSLQEFAKLSGPGFTSLPDDQEYLQHKIDVAEKSFTNAIANKDALYFFVVEEITTGKLVGVTAIAACAGSQQPFYSYKINLLTHIYEPLEIHKELQALHLVNDYQDCSSVKTLFLHPDLRGSGLARLLARSRFLFIANHTKNFSETIIAEMRGILDEQGNSPFWRSLGYHFFDMKFSEADYLSGVHGNQFITNLMPRYPIYVCLLDHKAQTAIGNVHQETEPALELLQREGFKYKNYVDIFDAGPQIEAETENIFTIANSEVVKVQAVKDKLEANVQYLISNTSLDFRAMLVAIEVTANKEAILSAATAEALQVAVGDQIRCIKL